LDGWTQTHEWPIPFRKYHEGVGSRAKPLNVGVTLLGRGEFSIIVAKLAQAGGLLQLLPALRSVIRTDTRDVCAPLLAKESERIYGFWARRFRRWRVFVSKSRLLISDREGDMLRPVFSDR
jgi:hypothetical protein